jgi:hypothetical protein
LYETTGDEAAYISSGFINVQRELHKEALCTKRKLRKAETVYPSAVDASFKGWLPEEQSPLSTGAHTRSSEKQGIRHRRRSQEITSI